MTTTHLSCKFLANYSAAVLVQKLVTADNNGALMLSPIWLNDDSQQVIGLWPAMALTVYKAAPVSTKPVGAPLVMQQQHRQAQGNNTAGNSMGTLPTLDASCYQCQQSLGDMASAVRQLINYQAQQPSDTPLAAAGYHNGFMGFINYDIAADTLANETPQAAYLGSHPLVFIGHYDLYLRYEADGWQLHAASDEACRQLEAVRAWLKQVITQQSQSIPPGITLQPLWTQAQYQHAFDQVQRYLEAGDCYQINLTQCWQGRLPTANLTKDRAAYGNALQQKLASYLPALYQSTQAPFAGYAKVADYELVSCSPELFFTFVKTPQGEKAIITKPIKGTRPRGDTMLRDQQLKDELANSDKDKAENVMIVDLLRNDLGKYAKTGSVQVPQLFAIESFSNVHHMVSTITATLKDNIHPLTVLFDSLPAGSITGTPKKRAVEIIQELEVQPRGAYCGSLGYLNFDGTGQWNVLIRTLQAVDGDVSLWAGGGITIASECEAEYQECFDKVGNLLGVLQNPAIPSCSPIE